MSKMEEKRSFNSPAAGLDAISKSEHSSAFVVLHSRKTQNVVVGGGNKSGKERWMPCAKNTSPPPKKSVLPKETRKKICFSENCGTSKCEEAS